MRKLLSVFTAFAMALTILTGSIALPLVARPFYRGPDRASGHPRPQRPDGGADRGGL